MEEEEEDEEEEGEREEEEERGGPSAGTFSEPGQLSWVSDTKGGH